jgi:CubicO group peptidase (beta-lactamase class C family)
MRYGRPVFVTAVGSLVLILAANAQGPPFKTGAGAVAHNLCSSIFVSGLPEMETFDELIGGLVGSARPLVRYHIDRSAKTVDASMLLAHAHAIFTPGFGCRLTYPGDDPLPAPDSQADPPAPAGSPVIGSFAPAAPVQTQNPQLKAALDEVFEGPGARERHIKAVVIVKDGRVVAERYAPGFGIDTPVMSFSVAKSVTNALLGILVRQGKVDMYAPAPIPEWQKPNDPRARITPDNLLRMESGLDAAENDSGFDPSSQMLYDSSDMGAFAAGRRLKYPPASRWEYSSANTQLLDRIMSQTVGGGPAEFRRFAETELFEPIGMKNVTLEFDGAGVFIGSSHVYAPARAFARLGQLFLDNGIAPDGRRILPAGWVAYSRKSTLGSTYGAGFWTNDGPSEAAAWRVAHGFPKDGYYASGHLGQRIYIVPSEHLVVARFGYTTARNFGIEADMNLIAAAISALR